MTRRRAGVSAVEFIVFTAMSLMLIGFGYDMLRRGSIVGHGVHQDLELQQGVRNLMENLVADVHAAAYIAEPHGLTAAPGDPHFRVVLWMFNDPRDEGTGYQRIGDRLDFNDGPSATTPGGGRNPWPFFHSDHETNWHLPVVQITYEWIAGENRVMRFTEEGDLVSIAPQGLTFVESFEFRGSGLNVTERVMCENVEVFEVWPFGYDELQVDELTQLGTLRPTYMLPDQVAAGGAAADPVIAGFGGGAGAISGGTPANAGTTDRIARTAMLWVKVKARFDYTSDKYRDPEFFLATRIWSHAKLHEHVYFPFFSSVDDDLRF